MAVVTGTNSSETLNGGPQNDTISGLDGADTILGDLGADMIDGGNGNDTLTGAGGSDLFLFSARNFGQDAITDFAIATDRIDLKAIGVSSFAALQPFITQAGSDTVITLGFNGVTESIRLQGVTAGQLTASNFVFFTNPVPVLGGSTLLAGTENADVIFGSSINDVFIGLAGNDRIDGDAGTLDELSYQFRTTGTGLTAATGNRTFTVTASGVTDSAGQFSTTFSNIERVTFDTDTSNPTGFATGETTIDGSTFTGAAGLNISHTNSTNALTFTGSALADSVAVGHGSHMLDGGAGFDRASLTLDGAAASSISQSGETVRVVTGDTVTELSNFEFIRLSRGFNEGGSIFASDVTSALNINVSIDESSRFIIGGSGNDIFENHDLGSTLAPGTTTMTGGAGADTYSYSRLGNNFDQDVITDFANEDRIDFSGIGSLNPTTPARFIGTAAFTNVANQIRYVKSGSTTLLQADSNGDGIADATLTISNGAFDLRETSAGSAVLQIIPAIAGSNVADTLTGTAIADRIFASGGDDRIIGSTGPDFIDGGAGSDRLEYQFSANGTGLSGFAGNRTFTITASGVTDSAGQINTGFQNIERVSFDTNAFNFGASSGQAVFTGFSTGTTTFNASAFTGASGVNVNNAPYSNNVVFTGSAAGDYIAVGPGAHMLDGGAGSDIAQVILSGTTNTTLTQTGTTIRATTGSNITDISNFEQVSVSLQFNGGASINATGVTSALVFSVSYGTSNQSVTGGSGNDRFENHFGGGSTTIGTTTMTGGAGADTYSYTGFGTNFDKDVIADFANEDRIDLSLIGLFNPSAPVRFIGTAAFSNIVNQVRYVKSGSTTLLQVDSNGDGLADATLTISNGAFDLRETTAGSAVLQIAAAISGTTGNDTLAGSAGADQINALGGDDFIKGSAGADTIDGGTGTDNLQYQFSANGTGLSGFTGNRTFTITASGVTDSAGQINTGFQNIERVSFDTNAFGFGASTGEAAMTGFSTGTTTFNASAFTGSSGVDINNAPFSNNLVFTGSAAGDTVAVGLGAHVLDGGAGSDRAQVSLDGVTSTTITQTGTSLRATTGTNITDIINFEEVRLSLRFNGGASINAASVTSNLIFSVSYGTSNQNITGGSGNDRFENHFGGGSTTIGTTTMTGGAGADIYSYTGFGTNFDKDVIADFASEDRIDLTRVGLFNPASPARFIGSTAFTNLANQVRYVKSGNTTLLQVDGNGDGVADATLTIANGAFDIRETALGSAVLQIVPEIVGTDAANFLNGTAGDDVIRALGGDDSITERGGNDFIDGGAGIDRVTYDYGAATGPVTANFALFTPSSVPTSYNDGLGGTDLLVNVENIRLRGSSGNDSLTGSATIGTLIFGGSGADTLTGGSGDDFIYGDFSFTYFDGADVINAGEGDDGVAGDLGDDTIDGGAGFDTVYYDSSQTSNGLFFNNTLDVRTLTASSTYQQISDGLGSIDRIRNVEAVEIYATGNGETIFGSTTLPNSVYFLGTATIGTGGAAADTFVVYDFSAENVITGFSTTNDKIDLSNFYVGSLIEIQPFILQSGPDTVISLLGDSEAPLVTLRGVTASRLTAANFLFATQPTAADFVNFGSNANDTLFAGVGGARVNGLLGDDTLVSGSGADSFDFTARGFGQDRIFNFTPGSDRILLDAIGVSNLAALRPFIAQVGADTVITLGYGGPTESITLKGISSTQLTASDFVFSTGTGGTVTGTFGGDALFGSNGGDTIQGLAGDDTIAGGAGNDSISAGAGYDVAIFAATRSATTITRNTDGTIRLVSTADGTDTVSGVEQFQFADGIFSFAFSNPGAPRLANFTVGAGGWSSQDRFPRQVADVNGDGLADIVGFGQAGTLVSLGQANGTFANPFTAVANFGAVQGWSSDNVFHREMADVNNDGRADIVGFGIAGVLVSLAQANGTFGAVTLGSSNFNPANGWASQDSFARTMADVNGDGFADIVGFGIAGTFVSLGTGTGSFGAASFALNNFGSNQGWSSDNVFHREVGDVNGDGRADIVGFGIAGTLVALGQANGTFANATFALDNFGTNQGWSTQDAFARDLADVNGDGRDDVVGFGIAGTFVAYGQADGTFSTAAFDLANFGRDQGWNSDTTFHRELADLNGDGLADIVGFGFSGVFAATAFDGLVI